MKEKTVTISSWSELIKFVESINPYKKTIVLSGFINQIVDNSVYIDELVFTTKPVDILIQDETQKKKKIRKSEMDK